MQKNAAPNVKSIGRYLLDRLHQHGLLHIFGLPGDYVIRFDKLIEEHEITFVNTTREDTAGYMADAYARIKGLGAACITYGVGINIVNATAQAFVESSPLIVISGAASSDEFFKHHTLHHLINKSATVYRDTTQLEIFKQITIDQAVLDDLETAAASIDRVIDNCLHFKKPVYLEIPRDMVDQLLPSYDYQPIHFPKSNPYALKEALEEVTQILMNSKHPLIWAGHDITVHHLNSKLLHFAEKFQIPLVSTLLGKTVINEKHPLFAGLYQGGLSKREVQEFVSQCDCAFILGVVMSDVDTGFFTASIDGSNQVIATPNSISIGHHQFPEITFQDFIDHLSQLEVDKRFQISINAEKENKTQPFSAHPGKKITSSRLFECLQKHVKPEHLVVTDVGDCLFGSSDLILNQHSFIASAYFAALGSGIPEALGAQIAAPHRRIIGIVGDGGFQMTAMELSTAVRYRLDPVIILMNNHGFGTERPLIEGEFNNIVDWNYTAIPQVLGNGIGIKAKTEEELENALQQALGIRGSFYLIEVDLEKNDISPALARFKELASKLV